MHSKSTRKASTALERKVIAGPVHISGMRCNRCLRPMLGTTAYDGACACGGLIEGNLLDKSKKIADNCVGRVALYSKESYK